MFFPPTNRNDLPKAPSCRKCNDDKGKLEHYLTSVLPFSSDHATALQSQADTVKRRLEKNLALKMELQSGIQPVLIKSSKGFFDETISLPFQPEKIIKYCKYIVKGLSWFEWSVIIPKHYILEVMPLTRDYGIIWFRDLVLTMSPEFRRDCVIANGGFGYTCTRNIDDAAFSAWHLKFYGNLQIAGQTNDGQIWPIEICVLTGPSTIKSIVERFTGTKNESFGI